MKSRFKIGDRVWVSPQLTGKDKWIQGSIMLQKEI